MSRLLVRTTGVGFAVLVLASEILKGNSPSPTGPENKIVSFFADHRSAILAGAYVQMLALFLLALAFSALADELMPRDTLAGKLGRLGLILTLVAYTTYVFWTSALAFGAAVDAGSQTARALWQIRFVSETFLSFPVALLIGSVGVSTRGTVMDRWYRWFSLTIAALFLLGGAAVARNGFFAPDGGLGFILFWLLPLWVVVTVFAATRRRDPAPSQAAAAA